MYTKLSASFDNPQMHGNLFTCRMNFEGFEFHGYIVAYHAKITLKQRRSILTFAT